jgi:hypothetical protein
MLIISDTAYANPLPLPCPVAPAGAALGTGAALTLGFIGIVGALCLYDIWLKINGFKNWDGTPKVPQQVQHNFSWRLP